MHVNLHGKSKQDSMCSKKCVKKTKQLMFENNGIKVYGCHVSCRCIAVSTLRPLRLSISSAALFKMQFEAAG